jgi:prepilin-type N-terminal cleavage/methylation domain-containing protein
MARAFTLVELMVAIAVLIVIAALALPSMESLSEASRFRSACDQLSSAASVCRAEAKRTGKPVAVVATMNQDGRQAIVSVPLGDAATLGENSEIEVDSRVLMVMPPGIAIRAKESVAADRSDRPISVAVDEQDAGTTQSLIIFWADGGATVTTPMVVTGPGGRTAGAKVNTPGPGR